MRQRSNIGDITVTRPDSCSETKDKIMHNVIYKMPTQPELDAITNEARRQRALFIQGLVRRLFTRKPARKPAGGAAPAH